MMFKVIFFLACVILTDAQSVLVAPRVVYSDNEAPTPYRFSYTAPAEGGSSSHEESGDGSGRVTGSYSVEDEDGRSRLVEYVADEDGFRASISTNEPGTANQNPADVTIASSADGGPGEPQVLESPVAAVSPVVPPEPVAPARVSPRPPSLPVRRPTLVPIQPALVPIQPALVPIQPALLPPPPTFFPPRFITEPAVFPFGTGRFVPRPTLVQFDNRRVVAQPALVPIDDPRIIRDPFFNRNFIRPLDRNILI